MKIIVSVHDKKADEFQGIFLVPSLAVAIRMFADTLADTETIMYKHPEDFCLYKVGEFNTETAEIQSGFMMIIEALEVLRRNEPQEIDTNE
jgi:hypothetical protein